MHRAMDAKRPVRAIDSFQQRHAGLAVPVAVIRKFGDDQGGNLAGLIASGLLGGGSGLLGPSAGSRSRSPSTCSSGSASARC